MPAPTDLALSRRLERTEGRANAAFIDARRVLSPQRAATWIEVDGTLAMFDGIGSPITQTFGLGIDGMPGDATLDAIEAFFDERGADVHHEVSPLTEPALLGVLSARGYRPIELTSLLHQDIDASTPPPSSPIAVRPIDASEAARWARTAALGWAAEAPALGEFMEGFGTLTATARGVVPFLAELDGEAIAAAAVAIHEGVALLAGASTRREWRGRGAQSALLRARLRYAATHGCDLAMMGAAPGSASQRNAERQGFRIAYTRIKWMRPTRGVA